MDKHELLKNIRDEIEAFGKEKEVYVQWIGTQPVDYSHVPERKCNDPETLGNLLDMLTEED